MYWKLLSTLISSALPKSLKMKKKKKEVEKSKNKLHATYFIASLALYCKFDVKDVSSINNDKAFTQTIENHEQ